MTLETNRTWIFLSAIIGKGGKTIQDLRLKHHCQVQMADCDAPERVLIINGEQTDVLSCMSDILSCVWENHQRANKSDQSEVRALIHQSQAGALIGKRTKFAFGQKKLIRFCFANFSRQGCVENQRISRET